MFLYKFDCNDYDSYYIVMAENPFTALQDLKDYLEAKKDKVKPRFGRDKKGDIFTTDISSNYWEVWERWKDVSIGHLPEKYNIEMFESGIVLEDEHS